MDDQLTYPKPDRKAERETERAEEAGRRRLVKAALMKLDRKCINPRCQDGYPLDPHEIKHRSQGGTMTQENTALLCRCCHRQVQGQEPAYYPHRLHPNCKRVAGFVLMDKILTYWLNLEDGHYRWAESHAYIRDVIERKGLR